MTLVTSRRVLGWRSLKVPTQDPQAPPALRVKQSRVTMNNPGSFLVLLSCEDAKVLGDPKGGLQSASSCVSTTHALACPLLLPPSEAWWEEPTLEKRGPTAPSLL